MTTRLWISPLVFLAGYFPLMVILLINNWDEKEGWFANPFRAYAVILLAFISVGLAIACLRRVDGGHPIKVISAKEKTGSLMEYSLPYLLCFLDVGLDDVKSMLSMFVFLALLFFVARRTRTLFHSPLLIFLGYRLYEADYVDGKKERNDLILTRRTLEKDTVCRVHDFAPETLFASDEYSEQRPDKESREATSASETHKPRGRRSKFVGNPSPAT